MVSRWEGKILCRDFKGRRVTLNHELSTKDGDTFEQGKVMVVESTHRGRFVLRDPDVEWPRRYITGVGRGDITLIEEPLGK